MLMYSWFEDANSTWTMLSLFYTVGRQYRGSRRHKPRQCFTWSSMITTAPTHAVSTWPPSGTSRRLPYLLADRTNGRANATVLCPSVVCCL